MPRVLLAGLLALCSAGCAFHTTAREWHGLRDPDGEAIWYTATTKVGMNLFVVIPVFGDIGVDGMIDELSASIERGGGDHLRIVQGGSENYWYGFPPLTWIFTPVLSNVHAEWRPHPVALASYAASCDVQRRHEQEQTEPQERDAE